jgi:radical SAM protein with 4Fe4S-binding SPASM domain
MDAWQLAGAVSLRPEAFGGMAFHGERGVTLEVDVEAYRFLCAYREPGPLPTPGHPAARLLSQLVRLGFIAPADGSREQPQATPDIPWLGDGSTLSAPETVHLAITTRCNLACPGCYVPHFATGPELGAAELRALIDQWARMRVFQLAVGGGEPLLRQDLFDVLAYARERGIVPNLTTNGTLLTPDAVRHLEQAGVARVNLSWCGPGGRGQGRAVVRALRLLLDSTLRVGVNLLVTRALLPRLPQALARLQALGVRQVTILRPKPPAIPSQVGAAWYEANRLRRADLLCLRDVLNGWQGILHLEVDSALVGLMGDTDAATLCWRGIHGCAAGRRICTVWPDGRVSPCSFLADVSAGSVRRTPFAELWRRGKGWEALRDPTARPQGGCAGCEAAVQCGGARCVARYERGDPFAGDGECPHCREEVGCAF